MIRLGRALLTQPKFLIQIDNPDQSIVDANDSLDTYLKTNREGTVGWCFALLNRSIAYMLKKDFEKAREDALDAHEALLVRCGRYSTNVYFSCHVIAKANKAFANELDTLQANDRYIKEYSCLLPRTLPTLWKKKGMTLGNYLRLEAKEYESLGECIKRMPGRQFMRNKNEPGWVWDESRSEQENW